MTPLRTLQAYAQAPRPKPRAEEKCELCGIVIPPRHRHLIDLEKRSLCCGCQACSLLFMKAGAAGGRYRTIPDRIRVDPTFTLTDALWAKLEIPVRLAFVFFNSRQQRWVALYPSPAGATESQLGLQAWAELAASSRLIGAIEPDVEALLAWAPRGRTEFETYLVPIDACYELVARVRRNWRGFDGGDGVRKELGDFFVQLRTRSRALRPAAPGGTP